ncbi:MAG: hypothetical protein M1830_005427 [Pleopsidium flavum]|nr:MAG: hypothetical protein M1830_005427 [Pleopsidium flavum]
MSANTDEKLRDDKFSSNRQHAYRRHPRPRLPTLLHGPPPLSGHRPLHTYYTSSPISRLIILPSDDDPSLPPSSRGRPIGPAYYDITSKLEFMTAHNITTSVITLANPWLDFLPSQEAASASKLVNNGMEEICAQHEDRLFAFGTLPSSAPLSDIIVEIHCLRTLPHMRGVIMGTTGLGSGLDDPTLDPVWAALDQTSTLMFLHPHYGLPSSVYGPRTNEYGHVLPLALGFPLETTIAVSRMFLSGVFERFKGLSVVVAHSRGALPFLAGRVESCTQHERSFREKRRRNRKTLWVVFTTNLYLDAVVYSDVGLETAMDAAGADRVLFGTDHPFFPPLDQDEREWLSVKTNYQAVKDAFKEDQKAADGVLGGNAVRILKPDR